MPSHHNADKAKWANKEKAKGSTFATYATNTTNYNEKNQRECTLEDGNNPIGKCKKFKKLNVKERGQNARDLRLCFKCLSYSHKARILLWQTLRRQWLQKPQHRLLHRPYKNVEQKKNVENVDEFSNEVFNEKQWSASRHFSNDREWVQITENVRFVRLKSKSLVCRFVDESIMKALNLTGQPVELTFAGIHGTSDISSKILRVNNGDQDGNVNENITAYNHPNVNAGN